MSLPCPVPSSLRGILKEIDPIPKPIVRIPTRLESFHHDSFRHLRIRSMISGYYQMLPSGFGLGFRKYGFQPGLSASGIPNICLDAYGLNLAMFDVFSTLPVFRVIEIAEVPQKHRKG